MRQAVHTALTPDPVELTILMPCLNEAETLAACIEKAKEYLSRSQIAGEIIIADNGSTDGSVAIAEQAGARVVPVVSKGYGAALFGGIQAARGRYVIMGDADDSYDFSNLEPFVQALRGGADLVMGNRFRGGIKPGAMPFLHRYLGNPVLTFLGRTFFKSPSQDFHCGLRAFKRDAVLKMELRTRGMEFASEMVVKAALLGMRTVEVPTILYPDGRSRPPHLRTWRDGWRHLRFLLLYSPRWLFLYPGIALTVVAFAIMAALLTGPVHFGGVNFDVHTMLYAAGGILVGAQFISLALFSEIFATAEGLLPRTELARQLGEHRLEKGVILGGFLILGGIIGSLSTLLTWRAAQFGVLTDSSLLRAAIPSVLSVILGFQLVSSSFFMSVLQMKRSVGTN